MVRFRIIFIGIFFRSYNNSLLRLNRKHKAFEQQLFRNSLAILDWYHNMVLGISLTFDLKIKTFLLENLGML